MGVLAISHSSPSDSRNAPICRQGRNEPEPSYSCTASSQPLRQPAHRRETLRKQQNQERTLRMLLSPIYLLTKVLQTDLYACLSAYSYTISALIKSQVQKWDFYSPIF